MASLYNMLKGSGALGGSYRINENYEDMFPALSLEECVTSLPVLISESAIEYEQAMNNDNITLVEAAINESAEAFEQINEGVMGDFKKRVIKIYNDIKAFIASIIEKIKQWANSIKMSGTQLIDKYGDIVRTKDLKGFVFNGYNFENDLTKKVKNDIDKGEAIKKLTEDVTKEKVDGGKPGIADLFETRISGAKWEGFDDSWKSSEHGGERADFEKATEAIKKVSSDKRGYKVAVFNYLIGTNAVSSTDKVQEELFKLFRNGKATKVDLKEGSTFKREDILSRMKKDDEIDMILAKYGELKDGVEKIQSDMVKKIESYEKKKDDLEDLEATVKNKATNALSMYIDMIKAQNSLYTDAIGCITTVKGAITTALKERNKQDKQMFISMLNYKNSSAKNNSYTDDEFVDDFSFEF